MKSKLYKIGLLFISLAGLVACSDEVEGRAKPIECETILQMKQNDNLLKTVTREGDFYLFQFETGTIRMAADDVLSVSTDAENWKTTLTLHDQSTMEIPTLGTSIAAFVNDDVRVNPSGYNPLAARVRLGLPCGGRVRAAVIPKEGSKTPVQEHLFAYTHESTQLIDVLGLYADYINKIELTFTDKEGNERAKTIVEVKTEPIESKGFISFHVVTAKTDRMEPGLNLVNSPGEGETDTSVPYMVDADGEVRWILTLGKSELEHIGAQCGLHRMKNGHYLTGDFNFHRLVELDLLGNVIRKWNIKDWGYTYHHEARETKDGTILITVSKEDAKRPDNNKIRTLDHVIEFNPELGTIVKEWDFITMLDADRIIKVDADIPGSQFYGQNESNWLHNNGINEIGDDLLATARWQGVFSFTRSGNLKWIIAPHNQWKGQYKSSLLTPLDKNGQPITDEDVLNGTKPHPDFEWVWGVHCPVSMSNGHILVFDNGYCRNFLSRPAEGNYSYSRVVEYEVDEKNKTVRQIWQYGKERRDCYASAISAVEYLEKTGNVLFCPGMGTPLSNGYTGCRIIEVNPKTNEVVYELEITGGTFHRANRMSLYPEE